MLSCFYLYMIQTFTVDVSDRHLVTQNTVPNFENCSYVQLQQEEDQGVVCTPSGGLTLRRLAVWMCEPLVRLKTLAALVDVCEGCISNFFMVSKSFKGR